MAAVIVKAKKRLDNLNRNSDKAIAGGPTISHSAENKARDVLAGRAAKTSSQLKKKQDRRSARKDQAGVGGALGNSKERRVHARMDKQDTAADRSGRDLYSTGSRMDKIAKQGSSEVSNQSPNREDRARIKLAARTARKSLVPSRGRVRVDRERHM
jgi:hypothetical protein